MSRARVHLLVGTDALCGRVPASVAAMSTDPADVTCKWCCERHMARELGKQRAAEGAFGGGTK